MRYDRSVALAIVLAMCGGCAVTSPDVIVRKAEYDGRQQAARDMGSIASWSASNGGGFQHSGLNWTDAFRPSGCMGCHWGGGFESNGKGSVNPSRNSPDNPFNSL